MFALRRCIARRTSRLAMRFLGRGRSVLRFGFKRRTISASPSSVQALGCAKRQRMSPPNRTRSTRKASTVFSLLSDSPRLSRSTHHVGPCSPRTSSKVRLTSPKTSKFTKTNPPMVHTPSRASVNIGTLLRRSRCRSLHRLVSRARWSMRMVKVLKDTSMKKRASSRGRARTYPRLDARRTRCPASDSPYPGAILSRSAILHHAAVAYHLWARSRLPHAPTIPRKARVPRPMLGRRAARAHHAPLAMRRARIRLPVVTLGTHRARPVRRE